MPGELLPPHPAQNLHGQSEAERYKRHLDRLKQHTLDCESRRMATQSARVDADHTTTRNYLQKANETKGKRSGKCKTDNLRPKVTDQNCDVRSDHHDMAINKLKRSFDMTNPGPMVKPNNMFNGHDSVVPPSGPQMQNFMRMPQQFDFGDQMPSSENAKKAKIDANDSHFLDGNTANPSTDKNNGCNSGNGASVSVQIMFNNNNNESQSRIKTTVNVNTSIDAEHSRGTSESQSVSVNVGNSKEVKQETGKADGNQNNSNFTDNKQNIQTDQHCMNGGVATLDDVYTSELDNLLEVIGESDLNFNFNDPQSQTDQQQKQANVNFPTNEEIFKDSQFQCKTEKLESVNFASNNSNTTNTQQQQQFFSNTSNQQKQQQQTPTFVSHTESNVFKAEKRTNFIGSTSSQTMTQQNIQMQQSNMVNNNNNRNPNLTSQHIQKLSVSVDSKFNLMDEQKQMQQNQHMQHQQQQQQYHPQQSMMPSVPRNMPTSGDSQRLTPHPRPGVTKSTSPNPVSFSVSHQPHPNPNYNVPGQGRPHSASYYNSMAQHRNNPGPMKSDVANMQRARLPLTQAASQGFQQNFPMQRPQPMDQSKALQLQEMAKKLSPGVSGQWSSGMSASVDMSSNVSFNGHSINQQQRVTADMRSFSNFQNVGPTLNGPEQASGNLQQTAGNFGAASAAAQEVLAASQRQLSAGACGNSSFNHFPIEDDFANKRVQTAMTAKSMYPNRVGMPNQTTMHGINNSFVGRNTAQQMGRPGFNEMSTVGTPTGSYNRQHMDPSFHPNAMTNRSVISADSMSVRVQQSSNMSAAEQRFAQIQRQKMYKSVMPQSGSMPQRGPSPLSNPPISPAQGLGSIPGSIGQTRMQGNTAANMYTGTAARTGMSGTIQRMNAPMSAAAPSWNRDPLSQSQSVMGNNLKIPAGYSSNPNLMSGNVPRATGYAGVSRGLVRANAVQAGLQRNIPPMQGSVMGRNQGHVTGTSHPSMQAHNMANFRQQQQTTPFSPSGMNPNSGIGLTSGQMAPGYPTGPSDGVMDGLENVYPPNNSSNMDMNLLSEFID